MSCSHLTDGDTNQMRIQRPGSPQKSPRWSKISFWRINSRPQNLASPPHRPDNNHLQREIFRQYRPGKRQERQFSNRSHQTRTAEIVYLCTFHKYMESFTRKADWKRHEKAQHEKLEAWLCPEVGYAKVFYDATILKRHHWNKHG